MKIFSLYPFVFILMPLVSVGQTQSPAPGSPVDSPTFHTDTIVAVKKVVPTGLATTTVSSQTKISQSAKSVFFISCFEPLGNNVSHQAVDLNKIPGRVGIHATNTFSNKSAIGKVAGGAGNAPGKTTQKRDLSLDDLEFATYPSSSTKCRHDDILKKQKFDFVLKADVQRDRISNRLWFVYFTINQKGSRETSQIDSLAIDCHKATFCTDDMARQVVGHIKKNEKVLTAFINSKAKRN